MESVIMHTPEETVMIWASEEQIADVVKMKVAGILCDITLMEGETEYTTHIDNIFLLH